MVYSSIWLLGLAVKIQRDPPGPPHADQRVSAACLAQSLDLPVNTVFRHAEFQAEFKCCHHKTSELSPIGLPVQLSTTRLICLA